MENIALNKVIQSIGKPIEDEFKDAIVPEKTNVLAKMLNKRSVIIDREKCKKVTLTIFKIISSFYKDIHLHINIVEGSCSIISRPADGNYFIVDKKLGDIFINLKEKTIEISTWYHKDIKANEIFDFIQERYIESFGAKSNICYYILNKDCRWEFTVARPLELDLKMNKQIKDVVDYINFRYQLTEFKRTGIILHGPPGTGKSKIAEWMASKYGMNVYLASLDEHVDNTYLKKLFLEVPTNSIILFDEMHSQLQRIKSNIQKKIDPSGILSAIDGPGRLAYNVFVIITTNALETILDYFEDPKYQENPLTRPGRIDKTFELNIEYNK